MQYMSQMKKYRVDKKNCVIYIVYKSDFYLQTFNEVHKIRFQKGGNSEILIVRVSLNKTMTMRWY